MKLATFISSLASISNASTQFLDFFAEMDIFADKLGDSAGGQFKRNYKIIRQAVFFYQSSGVCASTITAPTYQTVDISAYDEQVNTGANVISLRKNLEDWIQENFDKMSI